MIRRATVACLLLLLCACARRVDEKTRRAFEDAADPERVVEGPRRRRPPRKPIPGQRDPTAAPLLGWSRVDEIVGFAIDALARGPDDASLTALAERWCLEPPPAETGPDGPVRTCKPEPPVLADGASFLMEIAAPGVIGLFVGDLELADARRLAIRARAAVASRCREPWRVEPPGAREPAAPTDEDPMVFCPVDGGAQLAVGRIALDREGRRWQVSVAVVGAG